MNNAIEIQLKKKWFIKGCENYCFTEDKTLWNTKTKRQLKPTYKARCLGYWIERKFISLTKLRTLIYKPIEERLPF
jgi:hypothetical protein